MEGQYATLQNRYDKMTSSIKRKKSTGQTSANKNIAKFIHLNILLALLLVAFSLQWTAAVPSFRDFKKKRLLSIAQKIRDVLGEDNLRKAALGLLPEDRAILFEKVNFEEQAQTETVIIEKEVNRPPSAQHRDVVKLFASGLIEKAGADAELTIDQIIIAYQQLKDREAAILTAMGVRPIIRDSLQYVTDDPADITDRGIRGWRLNPLKVAVTE